MDRFMTALCTIAIILPISGYSEERNLSEEIRALSVLCSSGASVEFRGQIEGGLNKLIGKVVAGSGELKMSENETDFLNEFKDERLRIEARKVFNDCAIKALEIVYNLRRQSEKRGGSLSISSPGRDFEDLTDRRAEIKEFLDVNGKQKTEFNFSLTKECQVTIDFPKSTGFTVYYILKTTSGSQLSKSLLGTNTGPHRIELPSGDYVFEMGAKREAGYYKAVLETSCS